MFTYQKGFLPFISSSLGVLIPCIFFLYAIFTLFPGFADSIYSKPIVVVIEKTIQLLIGMTIYLILPIFFGIFFSGLFPAMKLTNDGLKYIYFSGLIKRKIKWDEIDRWIELPGGYLALVIDRSGLPLINGLYMFSLYGRLLRIREPVLLFSPGIADRDKLVIEINKRCSN